MHLDRNKILSYNAHLNFIVLKRGYGKTWTFKDLAIKTFIEEGLQTVWVRRYKPELKHAKSSFLKDLKDKYPEHTFMLQGKVLYIDKKPAVEFMTLGEAQDVKSSSYEGYKYLIFDEFIIEGKAKHYIGEECTVFSSLLSTFLRDSANRKVIMLGNKVKTVNPYSIYFNLPDFDTVKYLNDRSILVYAKDNDGQVEENYKEAPLEKILQGTPYYDYALSNKSLNDSNAFVCKRPKDLETAYIINISGVDVGLFFDSKSSRLFFDTHCDKTISSKYVLKKSNLAESYFLLNKKFGISKLLADAYSMGRIYFNDLRTKTIVQELLDYLV